MFVLNLILNYCIKGVYGDILKVKIMYNRRDNALMQFKTYEQALNSVTKMDRVKLFDKVISVAFSKFPEIQLPVKNVIMKVFIFII